MTEKKTVLMSDVHQMPPRPDQWAWGGSVLGNDGTSFPLLVAGEARLPERSDGYVAEIELLAQELGWYESEEALHADGVANGDDETSHARLVVPIGLFGEEPAPFVLVSAHVRNPRYVHHEEIGIPVWRLELDAEWIQVSAVVPVEAVANIVPRGHLEDGDVLRGTFLVTGTYRSADAAEQADIQRLRELGAVAPLPPLPR